jgi:hypothetical protein
MALENERLKRRRKRKKKKKKIEKATLENGIQKNANFENGTLEMADKTRIVCHFTFGAICSFLFVLGTVLPQLNSRKKNVKTLSSRLATN